MDPQLTRDDLERALAGDPSDLTELVALLTPVIQARVARCLLRQTRLRAYDVHQEVEDLAQAVFAALFADNAKALRRWDPERGLSLRNFVGFIAERHVAAVLRTGKSDPWREDPTLSSELDSVDPAPGPDQRAVSRDVLRRLLRRLEEQLSPLGRQLFELLYLQQRSVAEVGRETGLGDAALYAWRSRLRRLARRVVGEILSENEGRSTKNPIEEGEAR